MSRLWQIACILIKIGNIELKICRLNWNKGYTPEWLSECVKDKQKFSSLCFHCAPSQINLIVRNALHKNEYEWWITGCCRSAICAVSYFTSVSNSEVCYVLLLCTRLLLTPYSIVIVAPNTLPNNYRSRPFLR